MKLPAGLGRFVPGGRADDESADLAALRAGAPLGAGGWPGAGTAPGAGVPAGDGGAGGGNGWHEDDARILRRTRLRLMAVSGFVTLVILLVLGVAVYGSVTSLQDNDLGERMNNRAALIAHQITLLGQGVPVGQTGGFGREAGIGTAVIPPAGSTTSSSVFFVNGVRVDPNTLPDPASLAAARSGKRDTRDVTVLGVPLRVSSVPVSVNGQVWVVQVVADRTEESQLLSTLQTVLLVGGLLALLAALVAGYLYAGRALVPIRSSLARQRDALRRQREFTANASHELRTPLTVIRGSVEDLRRNRRARVDEVGEALEDIDAESRHLAALVDDLLLLARTDSGVVQIERVPTDLADVAAEAAGLVAPFGQQRGVQVMLDPLPALVAGDALRLRQLVTILVDNAIRHSPPGTNVLVRVHPDQGSSAVLTVEDSGPGIRPEDMPRLFERFWRADDAPAGGTGLGLAIAKWIVEQHGGTIGAMNREEGGARFFARLPAIQGWPPQSGVDERAFDGRPDRAPLASPASRETSAPGSAPAGEAPAPIGPR